MGGGQKVGAVLEMGVVIPVRNEQLDGLAEQLSAGVAEERLGLAVDEADAPVVVGDDCGIGRELEDGASARCSATARARTHRPAGNAGWRCACPTFWRGRWRGLYR